MSLFDDLKGRLHQAEAAGEAAVEHALSDAQGDVMAFLDRLKAHTAQNPEPLFAVLRRVKPILIVKNVALVTRFEDVQEVLARDDIFQVTYGPKMRVITGGQDFFLGMQNSPEYERDVAHMRSVMRRQDIAAIAGFVAKTAEQIMSQSGGKLELVSQLSRVVPARWIAEYFGTVPPSDRELADW
jgi:cytochrome P450